MNIINYSDLLRKTRLLAVLLAVLFVPQELWAQSTRIKTYTFNGATVSPNGGGTLDHNGVALWNVSGNCTLNSDRVISIVNGATAGGWATLSPTSDRFYLINKITINFTLPVDSEAEPSVTFTCEGENNQINDPYTNSTFFDFSDNPFDYDGNKGLRLQISEAYPSVTINSITVEYQGESIGLWFMGGNEPEPISEWNLNWTDCLANNTFVPPLYDKFGDDTQVPVVFTSSNENVATVDDKGVYTFVGPGQTSITATFAGDTRYNPEEVSYTLTIVDDRRDCDLSFPSQTATATYGSAFTRPILKNPRQAFPITYTSSNTGVATIIDSNGNVEIKSKGTTTITATFAGNNYIKAGSASYTLTVNPKTLIVSGGITASNKTYNGTTTATLNTSGATLSDATGGNGIVGNDVVTVSATGTFANANAGTNKTVNISNITLGGANASNYQLGSTGNQATTTATISALTATLSWSNTSFTYDGTEHVPTATVSNLIGSDVCTVTVSGAKSAVGSYTATATALSNSNYSLPSSVTHSFTISAATMNVTASGYTGTYDGKAHGITVSAPEGATVKYGTASGTYNLTTAPTYTNAGTYTVYYQVTKTGYTTVTGSKTVTISKAAGSITYATTSVTKTYGDAAFTNALTKTGDGTVTYTSSKTAVATVNVSTGAVTIVGNGTTTITATVTDGTNYTYATKTATYNLTVNTATMSVTASGYTGTYDGKPHGITVSTLEGATVKYGTVSGTNDLTASPTYINVGTYTVYYQVTKTGYTTITGSKTVTIGKAAPIVTAPTAKKLTYTGKAQELIGAGSATGGTMLYSMDGKNYSTTIPTGTAAQEYTIYYKVVGDDNHIDVEANAITSIIVDNSTKYDLWIGDTQVSEMNCTDILDDANASQTGAGSFQYIPTLNKLFITNNTVNLTIRTTNNKGLTVYLAPNSTNAVSNIVYEGNGNAPLTITTDGNYPGTISLSANSNVISGFSSLTLEQNLVIMSPEDIAYDGSNKRLATTNATIGVPLTPITEDRTIIPDGGELQPEPGSNDINKVVDDILYTLGNVNDSNGDGYDDGGFIVINSVTTDQQAVRVTRDYTPGTSEYLEGFKGLTFMIPAGKGKISFDVQTLNGHAMKVMVGDAAPVIVEKAEKGTVEIPYNVAEPTYVYAYNAGKVGNANSARSIQKGKMTTVHIKVYGTTVKPSKVKQSNSAAQASGGEYQGETPGMKGQGIETNEEIEASKGDVNGDETANVADIVGIANAVMGNHSAMFDKRAADLNGDGIVNAEDIVELVNKIIVNK